MQAKLTPKGPNDFQDKCQQKYALTLKRRDGYLQWMLKTLPKPSSALKIKHKDNVYSLLTDLKSCSVRRDLQWGKSIHEKAVESRHESNMYVATALIKMYAKCSSMVDARRIFDSIQKPDVVCWTALLLGYAGNGYAHATLELFSKMKARGCAPDSVTYVAALKACTSLAVKRDGGERGECLKQGRAIHFEIGCKLDIFVQSTLIDMYANCGIMAEARRVFDCIRTPNVVCWNALLSGYAGNGEGFTTLKLFSEMKTCGYAPNSVTYVAALKACTSMTGQGECLEQAKEIHSDIGCCDLNIFVQNTLIYIYAKCGSIVDARSVFDSILNPNVVSWNALLLGYVENGDGLATLELFSRMTAYRCVPDSVTYNAALKACASLAGKQQNECLKWGREIHSKMNDCDMDIFVQSTLIDMYANCGSMVDARRVFDSIQKPNVVCWSVLLLGYAENGDGLATLELFSEMKSSGCMPDSVTYVATLKACSLTGALALGRKLHSEISEVTPHIVTCLIDFYTKCGSIIEAREVFDAHPRTRDVSTWTALLTGYGSLGDTVTVFNLFETMLEKGFQPDAITFVCILSCCSHAGLVEKAFEYFEAMLGQYGIIPTVMHYNCMVDILGRANQLNEAIAVIRKMPGNPEEVTWMTLLASCRKWKNVEIGRCAFQSLVDMHKENSCAYVLMAQIYGSKGMWEEQEKVLKRMAYI